MESELELAKEVDQLRKSIFWTRCWAGLLFICLGVAILALWRRHPRTVNANEFLLRDKAGNVVGRLGQDSYGETCFTLTANHDVSAASLCIDGVRGSVLDLHNLANGSRATLTPGYATVGPELMIHGAGNGASDLIRIWPAPGHPKITLIGDHQTVVWSSP